MKARHGLWAYALMSVMATLVVVAVFVSKAQSDCQDPYAGTLDGERVSGENDYIRYASGGYDDNGCATVCAEGVGGICAANKCPISLVCAYNHGACYHPPIYKCKCICGCTASDTSGTLLSGSGCPP